MEKSWLQNNGLWGLQDILVNVYHLIIVEDNIVIRGDDMHTERFKILKITIVHTPLSL